MELLASGIERYLLSEAVIARTLEVGYLVALLAELVKSLRSKSGVITHYVCRHHLSAHLVGHTGNDTVLHTWVSVEHRLNLRRIDILA